VRYLAHVTDALTLTEVVRFRSAAEAAAGLAVHAGDVAGIAFYIDNGRIHVGADQTAEDMAYDAWRADLASGVDSILLAPTNTIVDRLNQRARADRIAATAEAAVGPTITLADGLVASIGDTIRTRKNARWLRIGRTDFVRNGYHHHRDHGHRCDLRPPHAQWPDRRVACCLHRRQRHPRIRRHH
jgi:hypothetical protein